MAFRLSYIILCICFLSSCIIFRKKPIYKQDDTYQEISDINSHQTPKQIAKDIASLSKKQKRAYKKHLRRTDKAIKKRNKKKLKNIVPKIKTKKVRGTPEKSDTPKTKEVIIK